MTVGDNGRSNILGISKIGINSTSSIEIIYLVDNLKHNMLSISQLYNKDNYLWFDHSHCAVQNARNNDIVLYGSKLNSIYAINFNHISPMHLSHLKASFDDLWLWHSRLRHASTYI